MDNNQYLDTLLHGQKQNTSPRNHEIDSWVKKTTALQKTIRNLAEGHLDPDAINLKKFGLLSEREQEDEEERKSKVREELRQRVERETEEEKERERKRWWRGVDVHFGREGDDQRERHDDTPLTSTTTPDGATRNTTRYETDYTRWSHTNYHPDDPATLSEKAERDALADQRAAESFERANPGFCAAFTEDAERRRRDRAEKMKKAERARKDGNNYFKKGDVGAALAFYKRGLGDCPYHGVLLVNRALCHYKQGEWWECVEFCDRVVRLGECHKVESGTVVKALFTRAKARLEMAGGQKRNCDDKAVLDDLDHCLCLSPHLKEIVRFRKCVIQGWRDDELEECVTSLMKQQNATSGSYGSQWRSRVRFMETLPKLMRHHNNSNTSSKDEVTDDAIHRMQFDVIDSLVSLLLNKNRNGDFTDASNSPRSDDEMLLSTMLQRTLSLQNSDEKATHSSGSGNRTKALICLLEQSQYCRIYFRLTGYLDQFCDEFVRGDVDSDNKATMMDRGALCLDVISASVQGESRSIDVVGKKQCLCLSHKLLPTRDKNDTAPLSTKLSGCQLILTIFRSINDNSGTTCSADTHKQIKQTCYNEHFITSLSTLLCQITMNFRSDTFPKNGHETFQKGIKTITDLLMQLCHIDNDKQMDAAWQRLSAAHNPKDATGTLAADHPLTALLTTLTSLPELSLPSTLTQNSIQWIANTLHTFSIRVPPFRPLFAIPYAPQRHLTALTVLITLATRPLPHSPMIRETALATLINLTHPPGETVILEAFLADTPTLSHLVSAVRPPDENGAPCRIPLPSLPLLTADLITRLLLVTKDDTTSRQKVVRALPSGIVETYATIVVRTVTHDRWTFARDNDAGALARTAVAALRLLASLSPLPDITEGPSAARALVSVLPLPGGDGRGEVTFDTVVRKPVRPSSAAGGDGDEDAWSRAVAHGTFLPDVTKVLISWWKYLDDGVRHEEGGGDGNVSRTNLTDAAAAVERLVCLLANCDDSAWRRRRRRTPGDENDVRVLRTNAAGALARLVTREPSRKRESDDGVVGAKGRLAELKGMRILTDLSRTGRI